MSERRKHRRIPVEELMEARLIADGEATLGQVLDLNNAGAFVATDLRLDKNSLLEVELQIPGEESSLPLKAIVARRTDAVKGKTRMIPAGLGLVFMAENVMERAFIQKAVLEALKGSLEKTRRNLSTPREGDESAHP